MRSVCLTTRRRRDVVFHLFQQQVTALHRADLDRITEEFGAEVFHYDIEQDAAFLELGSELRKTEKFPPIVNARLYMNRYLPASVRRIVYLDCDTLVLAPIEQLYAIDLQGCALGAVAESFSLHLRGGRDIRNLSNLRDTADPYFNSGVLVIDIAKYAAADIPARIDELRARGVMKQLFFDQDILNLVFAGNWLKLNWRYNVLGVEPAHAAMNPYIVHFFSRRRPWFIFSRLPFHRMYRHVMTNELFYRYARHRWQRSFRKLTGRLLGRGGK